MNMQEVEHKVKRHAYRYLHFKVISVEFNANVSNGSLNKPRWPQNKYQLQVSRKCPLGKKRHFVHK